MLMSLRLKALRGAEQHYAAFKAAEAKDKAFADDLKQRMVKYVVAAGGRDKGSTMVMSNNNPHDLHVARLKALAIASGRAAVAGGAEYAGLLKGVEAKTDTFHYCVNCGEACSPVKCEWCGAAQGSTAAPAAPGPVPSGAKTAVLHHGEAGYSGCVDTYVDKNKPNHGRDDRLTLESDGKGEVLMAVLVAFKGLEGKVPPAAKVHKATLTLYCMRQSMSGGTVRVLMLNGKWQPSITYEAAEGLAGNLVSELSVGNYRKPGETNIDQPKPVTIDVTRAVKNWVPDRHVNHGVILLPAKNDPCDVRFVPSEDKRAQYRPRLEISYSE